MIHETNTRRRRAWRRIVTQPLFLAGFAQACLLLAALLSVLVNMPNDNHISTSQPATQAEIEQHTADRLNWELNHAMQHEMATQETP